MNTFEKDRRSTAVVRTVRFVGAALVACAMTATTFSAFASDRADEPQQKTVRVGDLDLTNAADTRVLYRRISLAARTVCENFNGRSLSERAQFTKCIDESTANTVAKLDLPALTRYSQTHREGQLRLTRAALSDEAAVLMR